MKTSVCLWSSEVSNISDLPVLHHATSCPVCVSVFAVQLHYGLPFFIEMHWYALDCYVTTLSRSDSSPETAVDSGRPRKHISRKKLKTDDETSGDCKNEGMSCDDDDDDDDDEEADTADDNAASDHADTKLNRYSFLCVSFSSSWSVIDVCTQLHFYHHFN